MSKRTTVFVLIVGLFAVLGMLVAYQPARPAAASNAAAAATATLTPTPKPTPTLVVPNKATWEKSPHADSKAEAFNHWNTTTDKSVPVECATCHSTTGYQDFLGADGSAAGKVDKPAPIGMTITCVACHNPAADKLTSVQFLSTTGEGKDAKPIVISGLGPEARCMVCHQGRATMTQVNAQIAQFKAADDPDKVVAPIKVNGKDTNFGFLNVHYFAAAITLYGTEVKGGYEYPGKLYDAKFDHVPGFDTCVGCHDPHTLQVKVDQCAECHTGVKTVADLKNVRMQSSTSDYNGNGNIKEGMFAELSGVRDQLYKGIQAYAKDVLKSGIVYDAATYPYFLADKNNDGKADKNDKGATVAFADWTPRLLKAAYNYQISVKDPGAFAHGNKYIIQLLTDSLEDLDTKLPTKIDMSKMHRDDAGHFAGNTLPFRDWDATGIVPGSCAKCHTATGLPQFIKEGVNISNKASNGFQCSTCHDQANFPKTYALKDVTFPSGVKVTFGDGDPANLCLACHQGRESTVSVTKAVAGLDPDKPSDKISFRNVHYFAAGATLFGTDVKGIFEYPNKTYVGRFMHVDKFNKCTDCHDQHVLTPDTTKCVACHKTNDPSTIRMTKDDYAGDGNTTEGMKVVVGVFQKKLYTALQDYAKNKAGMGIVYDANAYPYYFQDKNGDGKPDTDAKGSNLSYASWTPRLLEAAYNYQYSIKDPGSYVHNAKYVIQALYDSTEDLGGAAAVKGLTRPK